MPAFRTAGELCTREVVTATRSMALNEAARVLRERHVGCLVVVDETREGRIVVGLLTDRDIVTAAIARDASLLTLRVGDVMSADVSMVHEVSSVHDTIALMRHRRVRRVPVTSTRGFLTGVLTTDDIVKLLAGELQALAETITEQRQLEQMLRP